ncbi:MAG: mechanosensitive ion channel domain-containing protein [Phormidesmis sp.]
MNSFVSQLINPYTLAYLLILIGSQVLYQQWQQRKRDRISTQRRTRGLPTRSLLGRTERLSHRRKTAAVEVALLIITLIGVPIFLLAIARRLNSVEQSTATDQMGLAIITGSVLLFILLGGMQAATAFINGFAYKLVAAFSIPFQIGDHVVVGSISGRVTQISIFFIKIKTLTGQQVSMPTHTLWTQTVTTLNGQAPLCEMVFYLSSTISNEQYAIAENLILETVRSSAYVEPSKPVQIYCTQLPDVIQLTTTAHVTAAEHVVAFRSDVTRQFLAFARQKQLPLATPQYSS